MLKRLLSIFNKKPNKKSNPCKGCEYEKVEATFRCIVCESKNYRGYVAKEI